MRRETVGAAFLILIGLASGILSTAAHFVRQHVVAAPATAAAATVEIEREALRFAGQQPVCDVRDGQGPAPHPPRERGPEVGRRLRALISDVRSGRLARVDMPMAVIRVAKRGGFRYLGELTPLLADTEFEVDRVDLSLDEIDRPGPLLLVDHAHASGARILMWVD